MFLEFIYPPQRVIHDVLPDMVERFLIANDRFVIIPSPQTTREGWPPLRLHPAHLFAGRHRLKPSHHHRLG